MKHFKCKKPKAMNQSCEICLETVTRDVTCSYCGKSCCQSCFQRYIETFTTLNIDCMYCRAALSNEFLIENIQRTPSYIVWRSERLWLNERSQLPEAQAAAAAYAIALQMKKPIYKRRMSIENQYSVLRSEYFNYKTRGNVALAFNEKSLELDEIKNLQWTVDRCLTAYGQGWENFNWITMTDDAPSETTVKPFNKACTDCRGFLLADFSCTICKTKVCKNCHEKLIDGHCCSLEALLSIKAIVADSKPCPNCAAIISKVDGCDQMWCTQCHVTYSWDTQKIIKGNTHNPHYYEWMRRTGRTIPLTQCPALYPSYSSMQRCFNTIKTLVKPRHCKQPIIESLFAPLENLTEYVIAIIELHNRIFIMRQTAGNAANVQQPDNFHYRVKFLANALDADTIKMALENEEFIYLCNRALFSIYDMVWVAAAEIFTNFREQAASGNSRIQLDICYECYLQIQRLLTYANSCLHKNDELFGTCSLKFKQTELF